ncbi:unnamed protein product [Rotaria sp. Silwood2]|nr:unnamed protein product [Rotaria sp. Silwood2]
MPSNNNEKQLKRCIEAAITTLHGIIAKLQPSAVSQSDTISINSVVNNMNTFTLNVEEDEEMDILKMKLENVFNEHLPYLSSMYRNYLLNFLYQYDYDDEKRNFKNHLSMSIILPLCRGLQSLLASIDAFQDAWDGKLAIVERFIKNYPTLKDRPGLWGTTLLYSAAKNGHMNVVVYLVETAKCSVNAQNEQHLEKILSSTKTYLNFDIGAKAASTPLHGACFNGHLEVVQYLVRHGANYFIRNQALETPLMNIGSKEDIKQFFRNYLLLGYLKTLNDPPDKPILEETRQIVDCVWEYKPFDNSEWYSFSSDESDLLQQSLIIAPDQQFKHEIRLTVGDGIYNISVAQFLRSGKNLDENSLAWIRCRGSSILNFDCYSLWQIMFLTHPNVETDSIPSLKISNIPTVDDSIFEIELASWYNCDANTNSRIDYAMNYRQKILELNLDFISDKKLIFNLQTFSFTNKKKTITGFIRWIPKLVSNSEQDKNKIKTIDNFSAMTNLNPIPLTRKRLQQITNATDSTLLKDDELLEDGNGDGATSLDFSNDLDHDENDHLQSSDETTKASDSGIWTVNDVTSDDNESSITVTSQNGTEVEQDSAFPLATTDDISDEAENVTIDDYLDPNDEIFHSSLSTKVVENSDTTEDHKTAETILEKLKKEMDKIKAARDDEKQKAMLQLSSSEATTHELEEKLAETLRRTEELNAELEKIRKKEEKIKEIANTIKTIKYIKIEKHIFYDFLAPKYGLILDHLQRTKKLDNFFVDKIPKVIFEEKRNTYTLTVTGIRVHHEAFKEILRRILILSNIKQRAIDFYQRHLNRIIKSINKILFQVQPNTKYWKQYSKFLYELLKAENIKYWTKFKDSIGQKTLELSELFILGDSTSPWIEIRQATNLFMTQNSFINEIERLKHQALDKFIELNISFQRIKLAIKPTKDSIKALQHFIEKIKQIFNEDPKYNGSELSNLRHIPHLLQRLMIYYCCFTIQLPLYESSTEILQEIKKNTVITISTSTGSGKSTLLPALLIAEGYDKVIVTQPRRLPCSLICDRVNKTMTTDTSINAEKLAGWAVSGDERNSRAKILYLTDGLLKERLLNDEYFITNNTSVNKSIVLFVDEMHERSVNIDLCLALIARMLATNQALSSKIKVIISSATLHPSVPKLFQNIKSIKFSEFTKPLMGTLYPVTKFERPNANILNIVQELYHKRRRQDQILCFVNSVSEVNQCCRLLAEISQNTIVAYPLVQSQSSFIQQEYLEKGSVFFSTTVAETSLTFPSLKYVIDTGMINIPVYDIEAQRIILKEVRAAESTIKQRLGRLGRTQSGEYYALYDFDAKLKPYPTPQICQSDLITIEFSLRKSPLKHGLDNMKEFLPKQPKQSAIDFTMHKLIQMNILEPNSDQLTNYGKLLAKLPDFGSLPMARCVLAALQQYNCGRDLICLASILSVLNTTSLLTKLPQSFKSSDGDFMTLLNIMNDILLIKQSVPARAFNLTRVCEAKGLNHIKHIIGQALRRYASLEKSFDLSTDYREQAQIKCDNWKLIAKALLAGYSDNVFVSKRDLQDRTHHFMRYSHTHDTAVLDLKSTLTRPISQAPVSLVVARDILYLSSIRLTAIISFLGEIKADWIEHYVERQIKLNEAEENHLKQNKRYSTAQSKFSNKIQMGLNNRLLSLNGPAGDILNAELYLFQQMIIEYPFCLENNNLVNSTKYKNLSQNLHSVMKMTQIFNPMIWRWEAQKQVKITVNSNTATKSCEITVKGRDSQVQQVKQEFNSFLSWLQECAVVRHPNAGVSPRLLRPQMRIFCEDIEKRISNVTDPKRTFIDLYNSVKSSTATRETRMEVVAWIAVCKFDCKLEGGFVRDWIVGKYTAPLDRTNSNDWIEYNTNYNNEQIPSMKREVVPADLDCHLPTHAYFDIEKFQDELYKLGISCKYYRENWRYILLIDENTRTGPFTMDLIEPHVALTHDRIDFDVSNLVLEKNYTRDLGMRIDIQQKPYSIELETIVDNIKNKRFYVLRTIDNRVTQRIDKMVNVRQWKQLGQTFNVLPNPHPKCNVLLVPLHHTSTSYIALSQRMKLIDNSLKIISIEEIKNPYLEEIYDGMKKVIAKQCVGFNPNENELFHGTSGDGINGITEDGFDDRFFNINGAWGHGAYFADDARKSHNYTNPAAEDGSRVIFYNKVLLGNESIYSTVDNSLISAPIGHHSVRGTGFTYKEYIVYRYGQARPYLKIIYSV